MTGRCDAGLLLHSQGVGFEGRHTLSTSKIVMIQGKWSRQKWPLARSYSVPLSNPAVTLQRQPSSAAAISSMCCQDRTSPDEVRKEIQSCYQLINKLGRGVVYLGSSRVKEDHPHYLQAFELAREVAKLLDCTTWTGAGPGLMDAATKGALEAKKKVGGFKISKEAGEWTASSIHPYLPPDTYLTCRFFSARKHGLFDAAARNHASDTTAVVALPGGIGTLDEMFEFLALLQLGRLGSKFPVPFLLMNYGSFYSNLLAFLEDCQTHQVVASGELASLWKVCDDNHEALEYLAEIYGLSSGPEPPPLPTAAAEAEP